MRDDPMISSSAAILTFLGLICILIGIMGNAFYTTDLFDGSRLDKPAPHWFGRTLFIGAGTVLVILGIYRLIHAP